MPYNTRRKSLSLESLGIHVPVTHAARDAARAAAHHRASDRAGSPAAPAASSAHRHLTPTSDIESSTSSASASTSAPKLKRDAADDAQPASKRAKRAHTAGGKSFSSAKPTPPPSPRHMRQASVDSTIDVDAACDVRSGSVELADADEDAAIDLDAVNDDIVEAVIRLLQSTGNRPHLIKELSANLMLELKSVQQSANPCAIISSRLASYMKRPCWSDAVRCPLTKELESIHPRRTYYFLTTCPHLPLPDPTSSHFIVPRTSIVSPPLSSAPSSSEAAEEERRRELSPSPEVDLSSPEWDDDDDDLTPGTPMGSYSGRFPRPSSGYVARNHRGSPPLEKDEKEFTQTAEGLQKRKLAGQTFSLSGAPAAAALPPSSTGAAASAGGMDVDDERGRDESLLFGTESRHLDVHAAGGSSSFALMTSPAMRPLFHAGPRKDVEADGWAKLDVLLDWDRSPENVELEELDGLLNEF